MHSKFLFFFNLQYRYFRFINYCFLRYVHNLDLSHFRDLTDEQEILSIHNFGVVKGRMKTELMFDINCIADAIIEELIMNSNFDDNFLFYFGTYQKVV